MRLEGRKVMVTGCAGFIASHLAEELLARGNIVIGVDNLSAGRREFMTPMMSNPSFSFVEGDLLTMDLDRVMEDVEVLCHLAANPDVRLGAQNTHVHFEQNIEVTYRLLEAGKERGVRDIIFPSRSTVYGETDVIPTRRAMGPWCRYRSMAHPSWRARPLSPPTATPSIRNAVISRFANVVGTRSTHNVLHDFIRKLRQDPVRWRSGAEPGTMKSYVHGMDCGRGMVRGAEAADSQVEIYNIGSRDWMSVKDIADIVVEEMGLTDVKYRWTGGVKGGRGWVGDVKRMLLAVDKLEARGWSPLMNSHEAIRQAVRDILA
jgi:UDP-glucose 4-epimerase